ncbi:MAG: hypothetical protein AAGE18_17010 [Pseudomonadota bacterium]
MDRVFRTLLAALAFTVLGALAPAAAQTSVEAGSFIGIGEAEGMRIVTEREGERVTGRIDDVNGKSAALDLTPVGRGSEGIVEFPGRQVFLTLIGEPQGMIAIALPLDAQGEPLPGRDRVLAFVPEGTEVPRIPAGVMPAPTTDIFVDPDVFVRSYQYWPPDGVARGYVGLEARFRPLVGLYPVVLTDVLWKICSSGQRPPELAEALRGHGVTCEQITRGVERMQQTGRFSLFKREVASELDILLNAIQCARGYTVLPAVCEPAARRTSEAAVSLVTVGAVLARYR